MDMAGFLFGFESAAKLKPVNMAKRRSSYASYLIRMRSVQKQDRHVWVVSMQSTATGELRAFPNVEALVVFLLTEFGEGDQSTDLERPPPARGSHSIKEVVDEVE